MSRSQRSFLLRASFAFFQLEPQWMSCFPGLNSMDNNTTFLGLFKQMPPSQWSLLWPPCLKPQVSLILCPCSIIWCSIHFTGTSGLSPVPWVDHKLPEGREVVIVAWCYILIPTQGTTKRGFQDTCELMSARSGDLYIFIRHYSSTSSALGDCSHILTVRKPCEPSESPLIAFFVLFHI